MWPAIDEFWAWWADNKTSIAQTIDDGHAHDLAAEISERVSAIHPKLGWELGPGVASEHHLCVTGEGDMSLRVVAARWLSRAPAADSLWEYYPARQASAAESPAVILDDARIELTAFHVHYEVDQMRARIHVRLFHPHWPGLDESTRMVSCFLCLDALLGEDDVETWIGGIDMSAEPLDDPSTIADLKHAVTVLSRDDSGEHGAILRAETEDGAPVFAAINMAIKRVRHLLLDNHYEVVVQLKDPTDAGLTTAEEADDLNALQDDLLQALGDDAVYIGRETYEGQRVIHLHASGIGPAPDRIDAWSRRSNYDIEVAAHADPEWEVLDRW